LAGLCHFGTMAQGILSDEATARAARLGQLKADAEEHSVRGMHGKAAALHYQRGEMHEGAGNTGAALDAYKRSLDALAKHAHIYGAAEDCYWLKGAK
jgi:hypothetical protein